MANGFYHALAETQIVRKAVVLKVVSASPDLTRMSDVRGMQARTLWSNGWGRRRFMSFEAYLQTIPKIPHAPVDARFGRLVLVDTSMTIVDASRVLGLAFGGDESVFNLPPSRAPDAEVYWMWIRANYSNANVAPFDVVQSCTARERGLTALEGVAVFAHYAHMLGNGRSICLAGSRLGSFPAYCACLLILDGQPMLGVTEYCVGSAHQETLLRWW